mgnify:CR=1 FL=1
MSFDESSLPKRLQEIASLLKENGKPEPETVRTLLSWFNAQRRGYLVVTEIRNALFALGLRTEPNFEYQYIDGPIEFQLIPPKAMETAPQAAAQEALTPAAPSLESGALQSLVGGALSDPTYRIGRFPAANRVPVSIGQDAPLSEAITLMLSRDFSQLPVMQGAREVKGVVSWYSIGSRLSLGKACATVRDCMEPHFEIRADSSLFDAIAIIVQHQYVLIRDSQNAISGIVTSSDLSLQFRQLAEPFLLLAEIENHLRQLIHEKFSTGVLQEARDPGDSSRPVLTVADLTFGEYIRLIENPERWDLLHLPVDRKVVLAQLQRVREIRNNVMHFDPDGIGDEELVTLREFVLFLRKLRSLGAV